MSLSVTLLNSAGSTIELVISSLHGKESWGPNKVPTLVADPDDGMVQMLEEVEYEFSLGDISLSDLQPSEIFDLDNSRTGGRVRPRGRTGIVRVDLLDTEGDIYSGELEVRSRKLDYKTEYRWMLDRIADEATELALLPFAASRLPSLSSDHAQAPEMLYQRFEFLRARLESEEFAGAVEQLRHRPHISFEENSESVSISRPLKGGRGLARDLSRSGPRVHLERTAGTLNSLPMTVEHTTHDESFDTVPNRFVKYAIEGWLALVDDVERSIVPAKPSRARPTQERAKRELGLVRSQLEDMMRIPAVLDAGRLTEFPAANTVLPSRSGYREFLSAFQATHSLAQLRWDQDEDSISAGQHDVPTLYEYWVFLELARIVGSLPGFVVTKDALLAPTNDGMTLRLRKNDEVVVTATGTNRGVQVELELWFNKSFSYSKDAQRKGDSSWTVQMRPDVSLSVLPTGITPAEKTWIHFDAKYKVKQYTKDFEDSDKPDEISRHALPIDVQKMHAYRDAIRRSAGAYVIYPGDQKLRREQFHELLPGLGAFALRPTSTGQALDASARQLQDFIADVMNHLTSQGTSYQRDRYWRAEVHERPGYLAPHRPFLTKPPSDTPVLLGYLRSAEHAAAVRELCVYNLRADTGREGAVDLRSDELGAHLLILYGQGEAKVYRAAGDVVIRRSNDLSVAGYSPGGEMYLCLPFEAEHMLELDEEAVRKLAVSNDSPAGSPVSVTWADVEPSRRGSATQAT